MLRLQLRRNRLKVSDCPLNGLPADSFSLAELPEHGQGQREFVAEQVAELLDVIEIFC